MKYLFDNFNIAMFNEDDIDQSLRIKTISTHEVKKRLSDIEGYESLIDDDYSANLLSIKLDISIPRCKDLKDFTPYDTLILVQIKNLIEAKELENKSMRFKMIELNAMWKVDYYSKDKELLKELTLGDLSYSEAKKEAFLAGVRIPYDIYDIYYIK